MPSYPNSTRREARIKAGIAQLLLETLALGLQLLNAEPQLQGLRLIILNSRVQLLKVSQQAGKWLLRLMLVAYLPRQRTG